MARKKLGTWPRPISGQPDSDGGSALAASAGRPANKTAAARRFISEHPEAVTYSDIIAGVQSQHGFEIKNGDVSNAKAYLRKAGDNKGIRKVKGRKKIGTLAERRAAKAAANNTAVNNTANTAAPKPVATASSGDVVSATLDLVAAVGLAQARAIIAGLGK